MSEPRQVVISRMGEEMSEQMVLERLGQATNKEQFELLKGVATRLCGSQAKYKLHKVDVIISMSDIRLYLKDHACACSDEQEHSLELLYAVCELIGCPRRELKNLRKLCSPKQLEQCKEGLYFKFEKMVVNICNRMTTEEFKKFFDLCLAYFDHTILLENYPTVAQFFSMLIEKEKVVWPGNVGDLYTILEALEKIDCLKYIDEYREAIGSLGQPISDPRFEESNQEESGRPQSLFQEETNRLGPSVPATDDQHGPQSCVIPSTSNLTQSSDKGKMVCGPSTLEDPSQKQESVPLASANRGPGDISSENRQEQSAATKVVLKPFVNQSSLESEKLPLHPKKPELIAPPPGHGQPSKVVKDNGKKQADPSNPKPPPSPARDSGIQTSTKSSLDSLSHTTSTPSPGLATNRDGKASSSTSADGDQMRSYPVSEKAPLLDKYPSRRDRLTTLCSPICKKVLIVGLLIVLLVSLGAVLLTAIKGNDLSSQNARASKSQFSKSEYVLMGDTVFLGTVDAGVVAKVTAKEDGDNTAIYLVPENSLNKHTMPDDGKWPTIYQSLPSKTYANIDSGFGMYLLENSSIHFVFNLAFRSLETGKSFFRIFNNSDRFNDYVNGVPGAENYAIFSRELNIGTSNVSLPTEITFPVHRTSYYFMAASTPADIYSNLTYEIKKVYLDHLDYGPECESNFDSGCSFNLPEEGIFFVLGYVKPELDESPTTQIELIVSGVSKSLLQKIRLSTILMWVGVAVLIAFLLCVLISVFVLCVCVCRRKKTEYSYV